ncbi:MAG: hypothetical protein II062_04410 [Oscillospiraceae bacterium]|nr:hypothetical protein [Oscillospiraceae bacterium]MBR7009506.1 hypothetical protein [Oscillospiraceae bacterium]
MKYRIRICLLLCVLLSACAAPASFHPATEVSAMPTTETDFACDAVFFGDSITCDGNFDELFPALQVVNLGVYGDTLGDLLRRVPEVKAENPARVFLLGGINSLRPDNAEECLSQYVRLLDALKSACPRTRIVVQSVLPVGAELDPDGAENEAVRRFNAGLKRLAGEKGCAWADLWAAYQQDGVLDPALTRDGIHLNFTAYGPWAGVVAPYLPAD